MRVLVVEEDPKHQESARQRLCRQELVIVSGFANGMSIIRHPYDPIKAEEVMRKHGWLKGVARQEYEGSAREMSRIGNFEAVLVNMTMTAVRRDLITNMRIKNDMPRIDYGWSLVFAAVLRGAKYVAMVTDTPWDQSASSAALNHIGWRRYYDNCFSGWPGGCFNDGSQPEHCPCFAINEAKAMFVHAPLCAIEGTVCAHCGGTKVHAPAKPCGRCDGRGKYDGSTCGRCHGSCQEPCNPCVGKGLDFGIDWGQVLRDLTDDRSVAPNAIARNH